jgi:hypothetical protein
MKRHRYLEIVKLEVVSAEGDVERIPCMPVPGTGIRISRSTIPA